MSQKTNPYSLRLQKTNKRFECSWYSDYFYNEMSTNDYKIRLYIEGVFRSAFSAAHQVEHSYEHLSLQNHYKRCLLSLFAIDAREMLHDKLLGLHRLEALFEPGNRAQKPNTDLPQIRDALSKTSRHVASAGLVVSNRTEQTLKLADQSSFFAQKIKNAKIESKIQLADCFQVLPKQNQTCLLRSAKTNKKLGISNAHPGIVMQRFEKIALNRDLRERFCQLIRLIKASQKRSLDTIKVKEYYNRSPNRDTVDSINKVDQFINSNRVNACSVLASAKAGMNNNTILSQLLAGTLFCGFYRLNGSALSTFPVPIQFAYNRLFSYKSIRSTALFDYLRMQLDSHFSYFVTISSMQASHNFTGVNILISEIVYLLSKRFHFRQITEFLMREASKRDFIKAIRLSCSGRLGGGGKKAQKSKTQSFQWGESSLHSFSSKISFASSNVATPFGKIGIKLWLSWQADAVICENLSMPYKQSLCDFKKRKRKKPNLSN